MHLPRLVSIVGAGILALALSGCMVMELEVVDETSGRSVTTQTISNDIYGMITSAPPGMSPGFCVGGQGRLGRNADNSVSCVEVHEGTFAQLEAIDKANSFDVVPMGGGLVRLSFRPRTVSAEMDRQIPGFARSMVMPMFDGQMMTVRIVGSELVETNMWPTMDGRGAETNIAFTDIISNSPNIPAELYAVVRVAQP